MFDLMLPCKFNLSLLTLLTYYQKNDYNIQKLHNNLNSDM